MDTMRDRFTAVTTNLLDSDPRVALLLADIGTDRFATSGAAARHPRRVRNVGIREQLLIGVAAGFALEGFRPIAHSYAPFLVERVFEQLKLDLTHQGVGAILVSVGASYDWAAGGYTHHAPGDIALLATLPGWRLHVPGHPDEVDAVLRDAVSRDEPTYVRLSDSVNQTARTTVGGMLHVERQLPSATATVIAVGPMLDRVAAAVTDLPVNLLYAGTMAPFDAHTLREFTSDRAVSNVVLVEPYLAGTSTSAVTKALIDHPHRLLTLGVDSHELRKYGSAEQHDAAHGLDVAGLQASIGAFLQRAG